MKTLSQLACLGLLLLLSQSIFAQVNFNSTVVDHQVMQRNSNDECAIHFSGYVEGFTSGNFTATVYARSESSSSYSYLYSENLPLLAESEFTFSYTIPAQLTEYKVLISDGIWSYEVEGLTCGDVYLFSGQSNSTAEVNKTDYPWFYNTYQNYFLRAFGNAVNAEYYKSNPQNYLGWGVATANWDNFFAGGIGLAFGNRQLNEHEIPIGIIHAGFGGRPIADFQKNANPICLSSNCPGSENPNNWNLYEFMTDKLERSGLSESIKYAVFYQGESDQLTTQSECDEYYYYALRELMLSWKKDYTSIEHIFNFQISNTAESTSPNGSPSHLRNMQFQFGQTEPDVSTIASIGLDFFTNYRRARCIERSTCENISPCAISRTCISECFDPTHHNPYGKEILAQRLSDRANYVLFNQGGKYNSNYCLAPIPTTAYYDEGLATIVVEFSQDIKINTSPCNPLGEGTFYDHNRDPITVNSISSSGNKLFIQTDDYPYSITYMPDHWYGDIRNFAWISNTSSTQYTPTFTRLSVRRGVKDPRISMQYYNYGAPSLNYFNINEQGDYYAGDFMGKGYDQLLILGSASYPVNILEIPYEDWVYDYLGNASIDLQLWNLRYNLIIVDDFDGDGKDELLVNNDDAFLVFGMNGGVLTLESTTVNPHFISPNHYASLNFNGNSKSDLAIATSSGYFKVFELNSGVLIQTWSTSTNNSQQEPILAFTNDYLFGDFLTGDVKDELVGLSALAAVFQFDPFTSQWSGLWTNAGSSSFNGITYPFSASTQLLVGNLDQDNEDEFLILGTASGAYITSMDFEYDPVSSQYEWGWNWSANPTYDVPYLTNWETSISNTKTKYLLFRRNSQALNDDLLALRFHLCSSFGRRTELAILSFDQGNFKSNIDSITDVVEETEQPVLLYPNPSSDRITISLELDNNESAILSVINLNGELITQHLHEGASSELDVSALEPGVYILTDQQHDALGRFVVIRD